jgi:hypothetical protein
METSQSEGEGKRAGERIAIIIYILSEKGGKSRPELKERFPKVSQATLDRDIAILKRNKLIVEKKEIRSTEGRDSRKVFIFYKDNKDIGERTRKAMEKLEKDYVQVTLFQIASLAGLKPGVLTDVAYELAPKLNLMIGQESIMRPPKAAGLD